MLSSGDRLAKQSELQELNIVRCLSKPVKQTDLFEAMRFASQADGSSEIRVTTREPLKELRSLDLLLAEDSIVNQTVARRLLEKRGHRVTIANNGREAVEALKQKPFDLVFMDVQMPEMDGLEAAKAIRETEKSTKTHTLIVAISVYLVHRTAMHRGGRRRGLFHSSRHEHRDSHFSLSLERPLLAGAAALRSGSISFRSQSVGGTNDLLSLWRRTSRLRRQSFRSSGTSHLHRAVLPAFYLSSRDGLPS